MSNTNIVYVDSIGTHSMPKALRSCVGDTNHSIAVAAGFWEKGDGGGGTFYWDPDLTADRDNLATIVHPHSENATTGCWVRLYNGSVNVKWLGAVGNGEEKDTRQNNEAFTAALASFDSIFVPLGIYNLSTTLRFSHNSQELYGEGYQKRQDVAGYVPAITQLVFSAVDSVAVENGQSENGQKEQQTKLSPVAITTNRLRAIQIRNFAMKGESADLRSNAIGIEIHVGSECKVEDLFILGFDVGLQLTATIFTTIVRVKVGGCGVAFNTVPTAESTPNCNSFSNCFANVCKIGFWLTGTSNSLQNCAAEYISGALPCLANKYVEAKIGYAVGEFVTFNTYIANMYIEDADAAYYSASDDRVRPRSTTINGLYFNNDDKIPEIKAKWRAFGLVQPTTTINGLHIKWNQPGKDVGRISVIGHAILNGVDGGHVEIHGQGVQIGDNCQFASAIEDKTHSISTVAKR